MYDYFVWQQIPKGFVPHPDSYCGMFNEDDRRRIFEEVLPVKLRLALLT